MSENTVVQPCLHSCHDHGVDPQARGSGRSDRIWQIGHPANRDAIVVGACIQGLGLQRRPALAGPGSLPSVIAQARRACGVRMWFLGAQAGGVKRPLAQPRLRNGPGTGQRSMFRSCRSVALPWRARATTAWAG